MDIVSYVLGYKAGEKTGTKVIVLDGDAYTFTDANSDGNVVIAEEG